MRFFVNGVEVDQWTLEHRVNIQGGPNRVINPDSEEAQQILASVPTDDSVCVLSNGDIIERNEALVAI